MHATSGAQLELVFLGSSGTAGREEVRQRIIPTSADRLGAHRKRISGLLSVILPQPVDVVFTNNSSTMISFRDRLGRLEVRLHRMFRNADEELIVTLARYLVSRDRTATKELDLFIENHRDEIRRPRRAVVSDRQTNRCHDLQEILATVSRRYFGDALDVRICWGRISRRGKTRRRRSRSRALATYSFDDRTIRVSPVLDSALVPRHVVEWIVYHELLHHVLPVERSGGRMRYHTTRFKALERAFSMYEEAKRWEEDNLEWLLR